MIPEGLILLTSVALTLGALYLANRKTLVQELYCIETLARVDTLCLDKTGTITEGSMCVEQVIPLNSREPEETAEGGEDETKELPSREENVRSGLLDEKQIEQIMGNLMSALQR